MFLFIDVLSDKSYQILLDDCFKDFYVLRMSLGLYCNLLRSSWSLRNHMYYFLKGDSSK